MNKGKQFVQLSEHERAQIEVLYKEGLSYRRMAMALSRPASTIFREIKRNRSVRGKRPVYYSASIAIEKTRRRHHKKKKRVVFDQSMRNWIVLWLTTERLSPKLISVKGRRIRADFVSHEWIYRWIWQMKKSMCREHRSYQRLYKYLRHARRRWHRGRKRCMRGNILQRVWLEDRPIEAQKRLAIGHLEADIMLGKDRQPGALVVLDRKSRKCWIRKLINKDAEYVTGKLRDIAELTQCKTITFDNDQSFALHYKLHEMGIQTFFTHPYSSQEKGSVENRIGIIRMFLPKKTEFKKVKEEEVEAIEEMINNRPLQMFNYRSANEIHKSNPIKLKKSNVAFIS